MYQYQLAPRLYSLAAFPPVPLLDSPRPVPPPGSLRAAVAMTARVAPPWQCHRGGDGLCGGGSRQGVVSVVPSA